MTYTHPMCANTCQYVLSQNRVAEATNLIAAGRQLTEGILNVSTALWCDQGNHAFSDRDTARRHFTETEVDARGQNHTVVYDMCGECAGQFTLGRRGIPGAAQDKVG
jgi:hypothetical protein